MYADPGTGAPIVSIEHHWSVPETVLFDRYRLIEPAGSGGSAEVWRARDEATGEEVAVKRLHPIVVADEAGRRRLQREFDALRRLDEPHIVRVRDLRFGDREAALVLDFVPGESLAQRLARDRLDGIPMAPAAAVAIVRDVAAALAAAHAAGIVHRDVTPGNILLTPDGEARLTDFGIAHTSSDATAVTATGLLMGTMRYLAPEQLRGGTSTPASDLHGLAAVAYEMLAGHPAYEATSPVGLADAQVAGPPPIAEVPAALDVAVRRGLAVDPASRPPDVHAFAASLAEALAATDVTLAMPIDAGDRTAVIPLVPGSPQVPRAVAGLPAVSLAGAATPTLADVVGVASPSRVAQHGGAVAMSAAAPASDTAPERSSPAARPVGARRARGVPAPITVALGLLIAVGLLAAATTLDGNPTTTDAGSQRAGAGNPTPSGARPTASPTPGPTATPTPRPHGKDNGHGNDNGD